MTFPIKSLIFFNRHSILPIDCLNPERKRCDKIFTLVHSAGILMAAGDHCSYFISLCVVTNVTVQTCRHSGWRGIGTDKIHNIPAGPGAGQPEVIY